MQEGFFGNCTEGNLEMIMSAIWKLPERVKIFSQQYISSGQDVGMYIIRDAAYPLTTWTMKYFPHTGILTPLGCVQPQDKQSTDCDWKCIGVAWRNRMIAFLREWGLCWSHAACVLISVRAMKMSINGNRLNPTLFLSLIWPYRPLQWLKELRNGPWCISSTMCLQSNHR